MEVSPRADIVSENVIYAVNGPIIANDKASFKYRY